MKIILQQLQENWFDVFLGFCIPLVMSIFGKIIKKLSQIRDKQKNNFTLDGIWCSIHENFKNQQPIEFIKIKYTRKNKFKISIKQVRENDKICMFVGEGFKSNNFLYIIYDSVSEKETRSGAFMLQLKNHIDKTDYLEGTYFENSPEKQEQGFNYYPLDNYKLYPIVTTNFFEKVKLKHRVSKIAQYSDAVKYIKQNESQ